MPGLRRSSCGFKLRFTASLTIILAGNHIVHKKGECHQVNRSSGPRDVTVTSSFSLHQRASPQRCGSSNRSERCARQPQYLRPEKRGDFFSEETFCRRRSPEVSALRSSPSYLPQLQSAPKSESSKKKVTTSLNSSRRPFRTTPETPGPTATSKMLSSNPEAPGNPRNASAMASRRSCSTPSCGNSTRTRISSSSSRQATCTRQS
jgi:hypothetical protein